MKSMIAATAIFAGLCAPLALAGSQSSGAAPSQKQQAQTMHKTRHHKKHHRSAPKPSKTPKQPSSTPKS